MNSETNNNNVIIIGSGIAGPIVALFLHIQGYCPVLFDRISDSSKTIGASLNIAPNGLKVLDKIGLANKVVENGCPIECYRVDKSDGTVLANISGDFLKRKYKWPLVGIHRGTLQSILIDTVKEKGIPIHYGKKLVDIKQDDNTGVYAHFEDGTTFQGNFLIGCDGLHSRTRTILFGHEQPTYTGITQTIGISPRPNGDQSPPTTHNIFGISSFLITYPFSKTHVAWAGTLPEQENPESWKSLTQDEVDNFKSNSIFTTWTGIPTVPEIIKTAEKIIKVGIYDRPALTNGWSVGRVILVGDAAHPTSPHLGQGSNQCMEDSYHLSTALFEHYPPGSPRDSIAPLTKAFKQYENICFPRTTKLVQQARAQGELRVCSDVKKCQERDDGLAKFWNNVELREKAYDEIFGVDI